LAGWIGPTDLKVKKYPDGSQGVDFSGSSNGRQTELRIWNRSGKGIFEAGDQNAGAASLTPDTFIARARRSLIVVAGEELALVDPQLPVEEMQLFGASMRMRWVICSGGEPYKHADPVPFVVSCQQLTFDARRDRFPVGLDPVTRRGQEKRLPGLVGETTREALLQRRRWSQHISRPDEKTLDDRTQAVDFPLTLLA
jgi:hypothetical protein